MHPEFRWNSVRSPRQTCARNSQVRPRSCTQVLLWFRCGRKPRGRCLRWGPSGAGASGGGGTTCHARCALEIRKCGQGRPRMCCCDSAVVACLGGAVCAGVPAARGLGWPGYTTPWIPYQRGRRGIPMSSPLPSSRQGAEKGAALGFRLLPA